MLQAQLLQLESSITTYPDAETALKDTKIITSKSSVIIPHLAVATPPKTNESKTTNATEKDAKEKTLRSKLPLLNRIFNGSVREKIAEKIKQEKIFDKDFPM